LTVVSLCHNRVFHSPERGVRRGYSRLSLYLK
jgi:hypothetical protein